MGVPLLHFLGTGTAFNQDGRASPSVLVEPGVGPAILVDAGPTLIYAMARMGLDCARVDRLFLTHLHGDHTAGWPFFLLHSAFVSRRSKPFDVYGPVGTRETLEGLARLCYGETIAPPPFAVRYHEIEVAERSGLECGPELRLDVLPMEHSPSSIGLRFHLGSGSETTTLGVSGDTGWCANLERLADGANLLLLECTFVDPEAAGHLSLAEVRSGIERLRADRVVLVHLPDRVAESLAVDPIPRVVPAHDGMILPLVDEGTLSPSAKPG